MTNKLNYFFFILFLLLPLTLITGPAIPDLTITIAGIYYSGLFFISLKNNYNKNIVKLFFITMIFWVSLNLISFFAENKLLSFSDSLIFLRILIIHLVVSTYIFNSEKKILLVIKLIFISVIFVTVDSLYQFTNYDPVNGFGKDLLGFTSNWYGRLTGPFYNELVPGSYVSKFGLIGLVFLLYKKTKLINFLSILYLLLIGVVTFVSGERMAMATYLLALFFLLVFLKNYRIIIFYSLLLILMSNFLIYKFHPFYNDYTILQSKEYHKGLIISKEYECEFNNKKLCKKEIAIQPSFIQIIKNFDTSAYGEIYKLAINMFINNPLTGVGINNFKFICENSEKYKKQMINFNCANHPHNLYIQWLAEAGLFVFFIFILYLFNLINFIIKENKNYTLMIIGLSPLLVMFWPIMSTGSLIKNWNGVMTFFIIGICLSIQKLEKKG